MVLFEPEPDLSDSSSTSAGSPSTRRPWRSGSGGRAHDRPAGQRFARTRRPWPGSPSRASPNRLTPTPPPTKTPGPSYLQKLSQVGALNFDLGGFFLVRIRPHSARLVTGFGKIFDLAAGPAYRALLARSSESWLVTCDQLDSVYNFQKLLNDPARESRSFGRDRRRPARPGRGVRGSWLEPDDVQTESELGRSVT